MEETSKQKVHYHESSVGLSSFSNGGGISQLIVDNLPQSIFWKDIDGKLIGCNKAFANLFGCDSPYILQGKRESEIIAMGGVNQPIIETLFAPLNNCWNSRICQGNYVSDREIITSNQSATYVIEIPELTSKRYYQIRKYPINDDNQVQGVITWIEDISDRYLQTQCRHECSQEITKKLLFEQTPLGVIEWDKEFRVLAWNPAAEKIFGYTQAEMIGQKGENFLLPTCAREKVLQVMEDLRHKRGGRRSTNENLTKQGHIITCEWYNYPLVADNGEVVGVASMVQDISERIYVGEKLSESEAFIRSVYDGCDSPIFVLDIGGDGEYRYAGWNATASRIFGIDSNTIIGKTLGEVHEDRVSGILIAKCNECLQTGTTVSYEHSLTFNNQVSWWITKINPLRDASGKIFRIVGTALEISDRKHIEEQIQANSQELQQTLNQLQQAQSQLVQSEKMSSLGQLVAGIAHEINNPVNFIYGNLDHADNYIQDLLQIVQLYQALLSNTPPEIDDLAAQVDLDFIMHDLPKLLASIKIGAQRIREIVLSLRTFSRMDEAEMKAVDIHEGIDSTLMILEHRFKASGSNVGIQIIKEYAELPLVECYAGQLNQVFMNILSNAIDALEEFTCSEHYQTRIQAKNDYKPQIKISTQINASEQILIKIADNGYGIPDHIQTKLFDPFFTTKPIGKGTGMGLSISYKIITERHNGEIKCTSQVNQGTEFAIAIPLRQNRAD